MKPFIGIDVTDSRKNKDFNGDEFIVQTAAEENVKAYRSVSERARKLLKRAKMPWPILLLRKLCILICAIFTVLIVKETVGQIDGTRFDVVAAFNNHSWIFYHAAGFFGAWILIHIVGAIITKVAMNKFTRYHSSLRLLSVADEIYEEFEIPVDAVNIDILSFRYTENYGIVKIKKGSKRVPAFVNYPFKAYIHDGKFYLVDLENKYAIPENLFSAIHTVKKDIFVPTWNKNIDVDDGVYKKFNFKIDDYGFVHFKNYHILEFEYEGTTFGIYFPAYELFVIEAFTGLTAEENNFKPVKRPELKRTKKRKNPKEKIQEALVETYVEAEDSAEAEVEEVEAEKEEIKVNEQEKAEKTGFAKALQDSYGEEE